MYIVKIYNNGIAKEIHGYRQKLKSGKVVKGINAIDSFSFTMLPSNAGFNLLQEKKTLVTVYNTNKNRYEFYGRVLYSNPSMSEDGKIQKEAVCESYFGFLCDSEQHYVKEQNWTVTGLLEYLIAEHNSQVEGYKNFAIGEVTVVDPNDNLYCGIQRKNTWETIKEKLLNVLGGEIRFRVAGEVIYLDYLTEIGTTRETPIQLSRNMKSITKEKDPSSFVSRLRPLGCKLTVEETVTDEEGNETTETVETEQRLDITSVNDGLDYIIDEAAEAEFGISIKSVEWDDVTTASALFTKGQNWLAENNKMQVKYSITQLDLSLLGLDIDDFDVYNRHPIKNALLGIDDIARIIKKTIDVCEEVKSTIEVGENFKTLSDIQLEQAGKVGNIENTVEKIENDYITNEQLTSESRALSSLIEQMVDRILLTVSETYESKSANTEYKETLKSELGVWAEGITGRVKKTESDIKIVDGDLQSKFNTITKYFTFDINGMTIGQVDNPNKVVIDNDEISILVNGVPVQEFKADGTSLIPVLKIITMLNLLGLQITEDETHINCDYVGV